MPRPGDVDHVEIVLLDEPVQMRVDEVQSGRGSPVPEQPRLDVLLCQRLALAADCRRDRSGRPTDNWRPASTRLISARSFFDNTFATIASMICCHRCHASVRGVVRSIVAPQAAMQKAGPHRRAQMLNHPADLRVTSYAPLSFAASGSIQHPSSAPFSRTCGRIVILHGILQSQPLPSQSGS